MIKYFHLSFIQSFLYEFFQLIVYLPIYSFIISIHSFINTIHSFINSIYSFFIHSSFIHSSTRLFIHLFNHSFINLFRRVGTDWSRCRSWSSQYAVHCTTVSSPTLGSRVWCASPASPPTPFFKCIYFKLVVSLVLAFLSISFNPACTFSHICILPSALSSSFY